jgi:hypothetical protein
MESHLFGALGLSGAAKRRYEHDEKWRHEQEEKRKFTTASSLYPGHALLTVPTMQINIWSGEYSEYVHIPFDIQVQMHSEYFIWQLQLQMHIYILNCREVYQHTYS